MASRVVKLIPNKTALFVCDIQEAFHPVMHAYPSVISTCTKMIKAAPLLSLPIIITEQNPSRLGKTVPLPREALEEMEKREKVLIVEKTKFSMMVEGVEEKLKEWGIESVIIFGIEVEFCFLLAYPFSSFSFSFPLPTPLQKKTIHQSSRGIIWRLGS
jgi:nicotinamidase-related amidase